MKALLSEIAGGPDTLRVSDIAAPTCGDGDVLIRVASCAINYPDALLIEDKYQFKPQRPFAPGVEVSGVVEEVGARITQWHKGDRVVAGASAGGLAELIAVPAGHVFALPERFSMDQGSALLLTYATTIHALRDRGQLRPGETILVLGAAGGTGIAAIEIGKALGARVIAAVSSPEKATAAKQAGADETLLYPREVSGADQQKAIATSFKQAAGHGGVDVVYDPVGGNYAEPAFRSLGWGGRYLVIGFTAGIPRLPLNLTLLKSCDIRGVFWGAFMEREPERNRQNVDQLFAWWQDGKINPRIDRVFPLEKGADAIQWVKDRKAVGKVVVRIHD